MKTERRFVTVPKLAIERRADAPAKLVGYAAVWYDGTPGTEYELYSGVFERVQRGAFAAHLAGNGDVVALFNHDASDVLGRKSSGTLELVEDDTGLRYGITLGDTAVAGDVAKMVDRGDVTGSSFGFQVDAVEWRRNDDGTETRILTGVTLYDVGPVTFPAYTATSVGRRSVPNEHSAYDVISEHLRREAARKIVAAWPIGR